MPDHAAMQRRAGNASLNRSARVKMKFEKKYVRQKPRQRVDTERIEVGNFVAAAFQIAQAERVATQRESSRADRQ